MEHLLFSLAHKAQIINEWTQWYAKWFNWHTCACLCKCPKVCAIDVESKSTCLCSVGLHL